MKKNLYYKEVFQRRSLTMEWLLDLFLSFASWPRMLLEVFIRKNFGERYFSALSAIYILIVFSIIPFLTGGWSLGFGGRSFMDVIVDNIFWYLYLATFIGMCIVRGREIQRLPSVFDFGRFSMSAGQILPFFYTIKLGGKRADTRIIETLLEPALFFVIGILFCLIGQSVGVLLLVSSIMYSLSYVAAYHKGDNFIMDKIDMIICNEELVSAFVDDLDTSKTRGVHYYGRKPADPETRRQLAKGFIEEKEDSVEAQ